MAKKDGRYIETDKRWRGIGDATVNDLDATTIKQFLGNRFDRVLEKKGLTGDAFNEASLDMICSAIAKGHDCEKILRNLRFIRPDGTLTVAAMLLFGKYTQRWMPMMTAKCICFAGNSVGNKVFRDKVNDADMEGHESPCSHFHFRQSCGDSQSRCIA